MTSESQKTIFSQRPPEDFFGRDAELRQIADLIAATSRQRGLRVSYGPGFGASELLKQAFDKLFRDRTPAVPIYFSFRRSDISAANCMRRFIYQYMVQSAAFRLNEPRIIAFAPGPDELIELLPSADREWAARLAVFLRTAHGPQVEIASALGAVLRAAGDRPICFLIDHIDEAEFLSDGRSLISAFRDAVETSGAKFVTAELRRSHPNIGIRPTLNLAPLSQTDSGRMIEAQASRLGIALSEQARDLIALELQGRPERIDALLRLAADKKLSLTSFREVQSAYTDEVIGGRTARRFRSVLNDISGDPSIQKRMLGTLRDVFEEDAEGLPIELWEKQTGMGKRAARGLATLHTREFVNAVSGRIIGTQDDLALRDHIDLRFRLEIGGGNRALVVGDALNETLNRAPAMLASFYRKKSAIGVRELLSGFDGRGVPLILFDYARFKDEFIGAEQTDRAALDSGGSETIWLPQIVQAVDAVSLYKPLGKFVVRERCAVGRGFDNKRYAEDEKIAWLAAEVDSKLEAAPKLVEFWCDRLEMVALICGFSRYQMWLISAAGFSEAAMEVLHARSAYGSSRRQVTLLRESLNLNRDPTERAAEEYEIVVPMGDDSELIAAHAVEEIAKRHDLDPKSINQIKTALVEACINAAEHSHNPDGKIYQRFRFDRDKMTVTVSNRGLKLTDRKAGEEPTGGRRGWGLALMRRLMDEVKIEDVEDGTSISMTKYLVRAG